MQSVSGPVKTMDENGNVAGSGALPDVSHLSLTSQTQVHSLSP